MNTIAFLNLEGLSGKGNSIAKEARLLKIAFLCSNASSLLSTHSNKNISFNDSEIQLIEELIELCDSLIEAFQFMYDGQMNLIPESEALETAFKLTDGELSDQVRETILESKNLFSDMLKRKKWHASARSIHNSRSFFKKLQYIILQNLDDSNESRTSIQM